jgi:hypothetical protein
MRFSRTSIAIVSLFCSIAVAQAWEANYPSGPVRQSKKQNPEQQNIKLRILRNAQLDEQAQRDQEILNDLRIATGKKDLANTQGDPSFAGLFTRRTVAYPTPDGVDLGHGWDFLLNQKKFFSCVRFKLMHDDTYQTVDSRLQQTIDEETLDISLNTSFSASASGTIEVVKASGEAKFSFNASHHMSSSDTSFIAHESATNGVVYAGPTDNGLLLRSDMAQLASTNPTSFRDKCGDGFVASIGRGADLYVMLHAHDITTEDKVEFETSAKASAGVADMFSGSASSSLSTKIDDLIKKNSLDIEFVQQGGIFTSVPTNLAQAVTKVQTFMGEEKAGPRSIYITLVPYSELPNWPSIYMLDTSDMRQRAIRYFQRLQTILYEVRNIRENYFREDGVRGDRYLFDYAHQLRLEDLGKTSEDVRAEMSRTDKLLQTLDSPVCKTSLVPGKSAKVERATLLKQLGSQQRDCEKEVAKEIVTMEDFNDFRFWMNLPIPLNGVSEKDRQVITNTTNPPSPLPVRQKIFKQALYRYWVERTDQIRCRLFFECLTKAEQDDLYKSIDNTVPSTPPIFTGITVATVLGCSGELDGGCQTGRRRFSCDQRDYEADARLVCEAEKDSFRHSWSGYNSRSGNKCGYLDLTFTCYNFTPEFPNGN